MLATDVKVLLDAQGVWYLNVPHAVAYTTQETAEATRVPGWMMAKTVIVMLDGRMAMAVVPASSRVNLDALAYVTGAADVELASEAEFDAQFPGIESGAMPPFGNLYDLPVYVSKELTSNRWIACNAGTHHDIIELAYADFERLVKPTVLRLSTHETLVGVG